MRWENLPEPVTRLGEWKVGRGGVELIVGGVNVELSAEADSRYAACEWPLLAAFWHHGKRVLSARCGSSADEVQFLLCSDFGLWRAARWTECQADFRAVHRPLKTARIIECGRSSPR